VKTEGRFPHDYENASASHDRMKNGGVSSLEVYVNGPIVLFDGVCNFCNGSVNFIIDHDVQKRFRFAPLQSEIAQGLLHRFGLPADDFDTMILVENGRAYARSTAALRIAHILGGWWSLLVVLFAVPPFLRDGVYNLLAGNRYRWFGKTDMCRVPTPELRERFLP
jgi:predicted DCC family thiol-disulfide oxidoreductase YuxK